MGLEVQTAARDGLTLVTLDGALDIYSVAGFREELDAVDPGATQLVIDLSLVSLLDSSGLGALVSLLNRARDGGREVGLVCPEKRLRRVFEIAGLRRAFAFGDDLEGVRAALASGVDAGQ